MSNASLSQVNEVAFTRDVRDAVCAEWQKMIIEHTKYNITDMTTGEEGPAELRARLIEKYRSVSLTQIRRSLLGVSRDGGAAKGNRATRSLHDRVFNAVKREDAKHGTTLSDEYKKYIASDEWSARSRRHKNECGYRCQLCGRLRVGATLHVHHIDYTGLGTGTEDYHDLLCVCAEPCHMIADFMRRWGASGDDWNQDDMLRGFA